MMVEKTRYELHVYTKDKVSYVNNLEYSNTNIKM